MRLLVNHAKRELLAAMEMEAFQLVGQKAAATWEWLSEGSDTVSEGNGSLIDDQFFKGEGHGLPSSESRELRVDRRRSSFRREPL